MVYEDFIYFEENHEEATPSDATPTDSMWSDLISFDSGDYKIYTVEAQADNAAAQTVVILYDIRNVLLIFLLTWLCITLYYRLKNAIRGFFS